MKVVIVAESGRLREGLRAMLDSFLARKAVVVVDDSSSALEAIRQGQPDLVILDAHLFEEGAADLLHVAHEEWSGARYLVVADRLGQFQPLLDAGAHRVLLRGFSAAELRVAVDQLMPPLLDRSPVID